MRAFATAHLGIHIVHPLEGGVPPEDLLAFLHCGQHTGEGLGRAETFFAQRVPGREDQDQIVGGNDDGALAAETGAAEGQARVILAVGIKPPQETIPDACLCGDGDGAI